MRHLKWILTLSVVMMILAGCVKKESKIEDGSEIIRIGESMFLTQINDMYFNFDNYKDKTVIVEGMFTVFKDQVDGRSKPIVYRYAPGCCGNDGWGGFLLEYDGDIPEDNAWIKVTGKPGLIEDGFFQSLYLEVTDLEVMEERGAEYVEQ